MEIKVVLSLVAILSAAAVALFCDYLRTRNVQLREAMVELKVRREEMERKSRCQPPSPAAERPTPAPESAVLEQAWSFGGERGSRSREGREEDGGVELTSRCGRWRLPVLPAEHDAEAKEEEMTSKQALSDWLLKRATARAAEKAAADVTWKSPVLAPVVRGPGEWSGRGMQGEIQARDEKCSVLEPTGRIGLAVGGQSAPGTARGEIGPKVEGAAPVEKREAEVGSADSFVRSSAPSGAVRPGAEVLAPVEQPGAGVRGQNTPELAQSEMSVESGSKHPAKLPGLERGQVPLAASAPAAPELPVGAPAAEGTVFAPEVAMPQLPAFEPVIIDHFLWQSLSRKPLAFDPGEEELAPAPVAAAVMQEPPLNPAADRACDPLAAELAVPGGFQSVEKLQELRESPRPFTGLVVCVGVSHVHPNAPRHPEAVRSVEDFLSSLMRSVDFGCAVHANEYVLICPGETGIEAQRYLSFLSERLWDFQLRALNTSSILFTLGGVDVQDELLADALAWAKERMQQTLRSRRLVAIPQPARRAV